jgi:hypothetical protein
MMIHSNLSRALAASLARFASSPDIFAFVAPIVAALDNLFARRRASSRAPRVATARASRVSRSSRARRAGAGATGARDGVARGAPSRGASVDLPEAPSARHTVARAAPWRPRARC